MPQDRPARRKLDDGIVVVPFVDEGGKRTSLSLDGLLYAEVVKLEGGHANATAYIRATAADLARRREADDPLLQIEGAGRSRLVQRMILGDVLARLRAGVATAAA